MSPDDRRADDDSMISMIRGCAALALATSLCLVAAGLAACSDDESTTGSPETRPASTSKTIGPAGGTLDAGGASVTIPPGALAADVEITLETKTGAPRGTGLESVRVITGVLVAKPHGTTFAKPVTVELDLIATPGQASEVYTLTDDTDTSWEKLGPATVSGSRLRFETTHFSEMVGVDPTQAGEDGGPNEAGSDGGGADGGTQVPDCFDYAPGGSALSAPIMLSGSYLYVAPAAGPGAGKVHRVKAATFTELTSFADMNGVFGFAANASGDFWFNNGGVNPAGLYRSSAGATPTKQADVSGIPGLLAATDANVFFTTTVGFDRYVMRADGNGQNAEALVLGPLVDQIVAVGGYVYWVETTAAATSTYCATPGAKLPQIKRVAVGATAPAQPELVVDGCAIVAISARQSESLTRFATDGTNVYAQSDVGELWKSPVAGGAPVRIFQPFFPKTQSGSAVAIVGSNLVFNDQDPSVGADPGTKKIPLAGGPAVRFAANYATPYYASDASHVYFATQRSVCRLTVP